MPPKCAFPEGVTLVPHSQQIEASEPDFKSSSSGVNLFEEETITVAFCDFDNSFAPSDHVQRILGYHTTCNPSSIAPELKKALEAFTTVSLKVLKLLKEHVDHLVILTNGDKEHVDLFTLKFLPAMHEFVMKSCIIISAKQEFKLPEDDVHCQRAQTRWKYQAAQKFLAQFDIVVPEDTKVVSVRNLVRPAANVICIGDSMVEHDGLKQLVSQIPRCVLKCIKLVDRPLIHQLRCQLETLHSLVLFIVHCIEPLEWDLFMVEETLEEKKQHLQTVKEEEEQAQVDLLARSISFNGRDCAKRFVSRRYSESDIDIFR